MLNVLRTLIGGPPVGWEVLEYYLTGLLSVVFVLEVVNLAHTVGRAFRSFGKGV